MGNYANYTCHRCQIRRPANYMSQIEIKVKSGSSGFSASFSPTKQNKNVRVHTGRNYYSVRKKWVCDDKNACHDKDFYKRKEAAEERERFLDRNAQFYLERFVGSLNKNYGGMRDVLASEVLATKRASKIQKKYSEKFEKMEENDFTRPLKNIAGEKSILELFYFSELHFDKTLKLQPVMEQYYSRFRIDIPSKPSFFSSIFDKELKSDRAIYKQFYKQHKRINSGLLSVAGTLNRTLKKHDLSAVFSKFIDEWNKEIFELGDPEVLTRTFFWIGGKDSDVDIVNKIKDASTKKPKKKTKASLVKELKEKEFLFDLITEQLAIIAAQSDGDYSDEEKEAAKLIFSSLRTEFPDYEAMSQAAAKEMTMGDYAKLLRQRYGKDKDKLYTLVNNVHFVMSADGVDKKEKKFFDAVLKELGITENLEDVLNRADQFEEEEEVEIEDEDPFVTYH